MDAKDYVSAYAIAKICGYAGTFDDFKSLYDQYYSDIIKTLPQKLQFTSKTDELHICHIATVFSVRVQHERLIRVQPEYRCINHSKSTASLMLRRNQKWQTEECKKLRNDVCHTQ